MADRSSTLLSLCALAMALMAVCCAPLPKNLDGGPDPMARESVCARSLQQLDDLIATRAAEEKVPKETIIEARALRAEAAELYLEGETDLALELINEAFGLLGMRK